MLLRAKFVEILRLRIRVPGSRAHEMYLQTNRVDGCLVYLVMNRSRNMRPVALHIGFLEVLVESDTRIPINADQCAVFTSV